MAASRSDSYVLATCVPFTNRVQESLVAACVAISTEGGSVANHTPRLVLVHSVLLNPTQVANYVTLFSAAVATDATILADATQGGAVALSAGNVNAQSALVTDAHIDTAIAAMFNSFVQGMPV